MQIARQLVTPGLYGRGLGWQTCIPFDTDNLTGEPIVQCNSVSDQMPCPAGVPQYPGEGYCPATDYGYTVDLFKRLTSQNGLGDCLIGAQSEGVCPDGSPYLGTLDSGGAAATPASCPSGYVPDPSGAYACTPAIFSGAPAPAPTSTPTPASGASTLPLNLPGVLLPAGVLASQGLQTNVTCPAGYTARAGACVANVPATAKPNWFLIGGAVALALVVVMVVTKR